MISDKPFHGLAGAEFIYSVTTGEGAVLAEPWHDTRKCPAAPLAGAFGSLGLAQAYSS